MLAGLPESQKLLASDLPAGFAKLRNSLKPFVGGNLSRVVYVAYANPAMQNDQACPGGRDGLDVHPAFNADAQRLKFVSEYVSDKFLPRLKQLARCEGGTNCRDPSTDRMSFVDSHQAAFAQRGFCARSEQDPVFDRECFSEKGESFDADPVSAATQPLVCDRRPSEFKPYASARALGPHRERQLLHRDDLPAGHADDDAAREPARRHLGRDERGLWRRDPPDRGRPRRDGGRRASRGAAGAGAVASARGDDGAAAAAR